MRAGVVGAQHDAHAAGAVHHCGGDVVALGGTALHHGAGDLGGECEGDVLFAGDLGLGGEAGGDSA
ncbi:hypothetical protein D3C76_1585690 [compost metagenome]